MFELIELAGATVPALHPERKGQLNNSPLKNWVEKNGGLPTYINSIATAILRENPSWKIGRVIATAVNRVRDLCANAKSKAVKVAACAAIAQWEKMKVKASDEQTDDLIISLSDDEKSDEVTNARMRKRFRDEGQEIPDLIYLSDDEYFTHVVKEEYDWEGVKELDNMEEYLNVLELSAAVAQTAMRLPLNMSEAQKVGENTYRKEILQVGELTIDSLGRKFRFTPEFLKQLKDNFKKGALDYVPLLYTDDKNAHTFTSNAKNYAGTVTELSVDNETNPSKLYGTFNLTEDAASVVNHNPKFGVSVTAHPNWVDAPRGIYHGPMLLNVAATHQPKITKMGEWEKVHVMMSQEEQSYEVIDLSQEIYTVETTQEEQEINMAGENNNGNDTPIELSQEVLQQLLASDAVKDAIKNQVDSQVEAVKNENIELSNKVNGLETQGYKTIVKAAVGSYRQKGVPPVLVDMAENLMLSFDLDERNEIIELSVGTGDNATTEKVRKVELVTRMLDEASGLIDLNKEVASGSDEAVELSQEQEDEAATFLANLANNVA